MAGVLHGSARAVPRVRAELQASQKAARVLAAQHRLHPKTVFLAIDRVSKFTHAAFSGRGQHDEWGGVPA